jgi:hypothetical protein
VRDHVVASGPAGELSRSTLCDWVGKVADLLRPFYDARSSSPAEASLILQVIRRLYEVEDRARPLDDDARRALRQAEAVPILEQLKGELDRLSSRLLPKSALAQAVTEQAAKLVDMVTAREWAEQMSRRLEGR